MHRVKSVDPDLPIARTITYFLERDVMFIINKLKLYKMKYVAVINLSDPSSKITENIVDGIHSLQSDNMKIGTLSPEYMMVLKNMIELKSKINGMAGFLRNKTLQRLRTGSPKYLYTYGDYNGKYYTNYLDYLLTDGLDNDITSNENISEENIKEIINTLFANYKQLHIIYVCDEESCPKINNKRLHIYNRKSESLEQCTLLTGIIENIKTYTKPKPKPKPKPTRNTKPRPSRNTHSAYPRRVRNGRGGFGTRRRNR